MTTRPARRPSVASLNLWFCLVVVLLLGGLVRFLPLGGSSFPLNDGGLFVRMSEDLIRSGFALPHSTSYNGETIPFAYPPLGLFLTAAIGGIFSIDATDVIRWLPAAISTLSVLAFYWMASELLRSRWRGLIAAAAFALMPRSYLWLVVGGGITRSLGLLFALLALRFGLRMMRRHRPMDVVVTAALSGMTVLAHPQAAVFLSISLLTLFSFHLFTGRPMYALAGLVAAGAGALLVASPWLIAVVLTHGVAPLVSAGGSGLDLGAGASALLGLAFTDTPVFDLLTTLGVLGVLLRVVRRQWMVPVWLVLAVLVDPRAGITYATVPLALSVVPVIAELLPRVVPSKASRDTLESEEIPALVRSHPAAALLLVLLLFIVLRTTARTAVDTESPLRGLQPEHLAAMGWVAANVDGRAEFAVVTQQSWERDFVSEWFPVITGRRSVATVQGSEWTGLTSFVQRLAMYRQLQDCAEQADVCLTAWRTGWGLTGVYVFLPKGELAGPLGPEDCCKALRQTLAKSREYELIYDGPGATIFAPTVPSESHLTAPAIDALA